MEKAGYLLLGIVALIWLGAMIYGMIEAFPVGLIGFVALAGIGLLFGKVLRDRINDSEDDHYSKNVDL